MHRFLVSCLLATAAVMIAGCEDYRDDYMVNDSLSFLDSETLKSVSVNNEVFDLPVIKNGRGTQKAEVKVRVSPEALTRYNAEKGTAYQAIPESMYTLSATEFSFGEKDIRKMLNITWKALDVVSLSKDVEHVIPLELISKTPDVCVDTTRNLVIVHPKASSVSLQCDQSAILYPAADKSPVTLGGKVLIDNQISKKDVTATIAIDPALIDAYNKEHGTTFKAPEEGLVSVTSEATIAAGESSADYTLTLNSDKFFSGDQLKDADSLLVPIVIKSLSLEGVSLNETVAYVPVLTTKTLCGPWKILEGEDLCYARDPKAGTAAWIQSYVAQNLFDGDYTTNTKIWISPWESPITFPMVFVVDMGKTQVFKKFIITDATSHQGNYRDFEFYTADTYDKENTKWNLVASGTRGYAWTGKNTPYDFPVQANIPGRYLKVVIVKPTYPIVGDASYVRGRGKIGDIFGEGF